MRVLPQLFENNRAWSARIRRQDPEFFVKLSRQQRPQYLWIGCSDSRVPANEIVGLLPAESFVHRNLANVVVHTDLNCLSVLQFAVEVLRVEHVIVTGHYGCGGVEAAWKGTPLGLAGNWFRHVQDVAERHSAHLARLPDDARRIARLCELNVLEQVTHVCRTTILQDAWARGQPVEVHGWIYGLADGLLRDLGLGVTDARTLETGYAAALAALPGG